jgi:hypothetical protein
MKAILTLSLAAAGVTQDAASKAVANTVVICRALNI